MNTRHLIAILAALAAVSAGTVSAQVNRCQDASGKMIYSDKPCGAGQQGAQIERRKSQEEIYQERKQAYDAEMRKRQRNMAEQQRDAVEQRSRVIPLQQPAAGGWAERKARENAATSAGSISNDGGRWDREAQEQRAREMQERNRLRAEAEARAQAEAEAHKRQNPTRLQSCLGDTCRDNQGGTYSRSASDRNLLIGNDGQRCRRTDPSQNWRCD